MKKLIIFICILLFFTACCKSSYKQVTVTFIDGTTQVYKVYHMTWGINSNNNTLSLRTINSGQIHLTNVKEVSVKTIVNHKTQY